MSQYNNELYHYGIKGMKWGVRRFQKKDGTLTSAGRKRYDDNDIVLDKGTEIHRVVMKNWHEKEKIILDTLMLLIKKKMLNITNKYLDFSVMVIIMLI